MRLFFIIGLLESLVTAQIDGGECTYAVELMYLQDASTSFDPWVTVMRDEVRSIMETFTDTYAEFKMGVASFVDKPIPTLGIGTYGGKKDWVEDFCYHLNSPLTDSPDTLEKALNNLYWDMGSGGDWREAPLDGLAYTAGDPNIGWSSEVYSPGGRPIVRVVLVVTDDVSHMPGDVDLAIHQSWEYPRTWLNETYSSGGFGATEYRKKSGAFANNAQTIADYTSMSELFYKYDTEIMTEDEAATLKGYVNKYGPYPWPAYMDNPNDGADPKLCDVAEYIAPEALGALLKKRNIVPVFLSAANLHHGPEMDKVCKAYDMTADALCLQKYYGDMMETMGVSGVSVAMGIEDLKETIIEAVASVTEMLCESPPTTPEVEITTEGVVLPPPETEEVAPPETEEVAPPETEEVVPPETEEVVPPETEEVVPPETEEVAPPETEEVVPPKTEEVAPPKTEEVAPPPKTEEEGQVTEGENQSGVGDGHTTTPVVVPPVVVSPGDGGSSTGTIAGATAGAAAGLAAIGGVLYRKFGAAMFGSSPSVPMDTMQQVEVPENPVERETMEEVTMDMFQ